MQLSRVLALVGCAVFASTSLVAASSLPLPILDSIAHPKVADTPCTDDHASGLAVLGPVKELEADVQTTLASLAECHATGANPAKYFLKLANLVDDCQSTLAAMKAGAPEAYEGANKQASKAVAKVILDISTGCSKFENTKTDGFSYADLCAKIDHALSGLCVTLKNLVSGSLNSISALCLPNSALLSAANLNLCLSLFTGLHL